MIDLEFVQRCVQADKLAWDEFVDKYSRLIYKYINCVLKQNNPGLATLDNVNDIFQEIFLNLTKENFKKLRTFKAKNGSSLASWLRQVTINYTLDYLKKHRPALSLEEDNEEGFNLKELIADDSISSREAAALEERLRYLQECIEALDTDDRYFLEFHVSRGLSLEIMKDLFKVSRGSIDMKKSRIVSRLRECFKMKGFSLEP
jgi:RNA polymerase sigma factor (sigma-70 family)